MLSYRTEVIGDIKISQRSAEEAAPLPSERLNLSWLASDLKGLILQASHPVCCFYTMF